MSGKRQVACQSMTPHLRRSERLQARIILLKLDLQGGHRICRLHSCLRCRRELPERRGLKWSSCAERSLCQSCRESVHGSVLGPLNRRQQPSSLAHPAANRFTDGLHVASGRAGT